MKALGRGDVARRGAGSLAIEESCWRRSKTAAAAKGVGVKMEKASGVDVPICTWMSCLRKCAAEWREGGESGGDLIKRGFE
jgi:hypothetical protein